jgi:protein-tyrosine-phosphatase
MGNEVQAQISTVSRRQFAALMVLIGSATLPGCGVQPTKPKVKILFVCKAGTAKSAIAREIFRRKAAVAGIDAEAFSRGIVIEDHVSSPLRQKLLADRLDTHSEPPQVLGTADVKSADIVVRFNPLPASVQHASIRDWSDTPSVNDDYQNARSVMDQRIDALIAEIVARNDGSERPVKPRATGA